MTAGTVDPTLAIIPDQAEVWLALKEDVTDIADFIPSTVGADLATLGWEFCGLIDVKGIAVDPQIEVKGYDAFAHSQFRVKLRKGQVKTTFTVLEANATTGKVILPGSASGKIGIPKDVQAYVLYRFGDEDRGHVWVTLTPAALELKSHSGIVDGELTSAEIVAHHTADANLDVFASVTGAIVAP